MREYRGRTWRAPKFVHVIGPIPLMRFASELTREWGVKTVASLNPIMVDGTGMCGGCRVSVGGKPVFACVDGPEFDAHQVDFDLLTLQPIWPKKSSSLSAMSAGWGWRSNTLSLPVRAEEGVITRHEYRIDLSPFLVSRNGLPHGVLCSVENVLCESRCASSRLDSGLLAYTLFGLQALFQSEGLPDQLSRFSAVRSGGRPFSVSPSVPR
jgi:hypothetical protein